MNQSYTICSDYWKAEGKMNIFFKKYQQLTQAQSVPDMRATAPSLHVQYAGKADKCNPSLGLITVLKDKCRL